MGGSPGEVREVPVTWVKQRKGCRMTCDVGEAAEGLENEFRLILQPTGAQEWHIVSLLGDVTSPTTADHYVSMTSDIRVLSTEKN